MPTSHLAVLESSSLIYPLRPVFRVPTVNKETGEIGSWQSISYRQFQLDVERFARFWQSKLIINGILPQSVVGVWYDFIFEVVDDLVFIHIKGSVDSPTRTFYISTVFQGPGTFPKCSASAFLTPRLFTSCSRWPMLRPSSTSRPLRQYVPIALFLHT